MDMRDGGYKSRKMWIGTLTAVGIMAGGALAAWIPAFLPAYDTFVGGLLGAYAIYCGGNVGAKVALKSATVTKAPPATEE